ncbi:YjgP/YjgQ family permease, partial [bacterium]
KYSLPLACLVFLLVGAPVGAWARKGGLGIAVGLSFGFFLLYWAFLIGGEEIADRGIVSPTVGMWSGNVVLFVIAMIMLYRVTFEEKFAGFGWMQKLIQKVEEFRNRRLKNK